MELKLYIAEEDGNITYVASEKYLKSQEVNIEKVLEENPTIKEHKITIRSFTGLMDREVNNSTAKNPERWSDLVCEKAILKWTIDKPVLENGEEIGRELYPCGVMVTENSLLDMPILLANSIRALVTDAVYLPVRNPFLKS